MIKFYLNACEFNIIQYGKGVLHRDIAGHSHSANSYELHYITEGAGTLLTDSGSYPMSKGDFFVTGPNVYHRQNTDSLNPLKEIHIYLQSLARRVDDPFVSAFLSKRFYFGHHEDLGFYFERIAAEKDRKRIGYESAVAGYLQILLTEVIRKYLPRDISLPACEDDLNDRRFLLIEDAFIQRSQTLTIAELSELIGLCERQTQRLLKRYYGKTFTEKKNEAISRHNDTNT